MRTLFLPATAAVVLAVSLLSALAQTDAPAPAAGASVPLATKPRPRPLTPAELRESATPPGDMRPQERVTPQLSIPLGKQPPAPPKPKLRAARPGTAASGGIDDAVARCEAQSDEQLRAKCRNDLARQGRSR
jgi:hypothetical protein